MENINEKTIIDNSIESNTDQDMSKQETDSADKTDLTTEEKLIETEDKLLRSLAEVENQRRRFEKEVRDAFEYGGFSFAKETLVLLDNLERAKISIKNDEALKDSKDLEKYIQNIEVIEKDLVNIFEKNNIKQCEC